MRRFRVMILLSVANFVICSADAWAGSIFLFHYGNTDSNAATLNSAGYRFDGPHFDKDNIKGSVELGRGFFDYARSHFDPNSATMGSAFYVSEDPFDSHYFGPDLLIVEVQSNDDPRNVMQGGLDGRAAQHDSRTRPWIFDQYPLIGKYQNDKGSNWAAIYRTPNDRERAQGVRVLVRPPEPNDAPRVWDAMTYGNDDGKIHFLEKLSQEIQKPTQFSQNTKALFHRMMFDIGYGFFDYYLGANRPSSRWHGEVIDPLLAFVRMAPGSEKSRNLLKKWSRLPGPLSDGHIKVFTRDLSRMAEVLAALEPADRDKIVEETIRNLQPRLAKGEPGALSLIEGLGPSIRGSARKAEFMKLLAPFNGKFAANGDLGKFDKAIIQEIADGISKTGFQEEWFQGPLKRDFNEKDVARFLATGRNAGLSNDELMTSLTEQAIKVRSARLAVDPRWPDAELLALLGGVSLSQVSRDDKMAMYGKIREVYSNRFQEPANSDWAFMTSHGGRYQPGGGPTLDVATTSIAEMAEAIPEIRPQLMAEWEFNASRFPNAFNEVSMPQMSRLVDSFRQSRSCMKHVLQSLQATPRP